MAEQSSGLGEQLLIPVRQIDKLQSVFNVLWIFQSTQSSKNF